MALQVFAKLDECEATAAQFAIDLHRVRSVLPRPLQCVACGEVAAKDEHGTSGKGFIRVSFGNPGPVIFTTARTFRKMKCLVFLFS